MYIHIYIYIYIYIWHTEYVDWFVMLCIQGGYNPMVYYRSHSKTSEIYALFILDRLASFSSNGIDPARKELVESRAARLAPLGLGWDL